MTELTPLEHISSSLALVTPPYLDSKVSNRPFPITLEVSDVGSCPLVYIALVYIIIRLTLKDHSTLVREDGSNTRPLFSAGLQVIAVTF
jgi:hypothetical protein